MRRNHEAISVKSPSRFAFAVMTAILVCVGCASAPRTGEDSRCHSPRTIELEKQDIRRMVEHMVQSLISDSGILESNGGQPPQVDFAPLKNMTNQKVDMQGIADAMRDALVRTRLFSFVNHSADVAPGEQKAAQMLLSGALTAKEFHDGKMKGYEYKFTMMLTDLRTGERIWKDEQEFRKVCRVGAFARLAGSLPSK